ncbi:MAG: DUF2262 domain-containing protein [Promethearchaeota archaeon]
MSERSILGKKIYVTGKVIGYKKDDLKNLVEQIGGNWSPFNKELDLLVIGDKPGSKKIREAKKFGIKTMSISDFFKILKSENLIPEKNEEFRKNLEFFEDMNQYSLYFDYKGKEVNFIIDAAEIEMQLDTLLELAKGFYFNIDNWVVKAQNFALRKVLPLKNKYWLDENEKEVSKKEFKERIELETIEFSEDEFIFYFEDGDLFRGHVIELYGNLRKGFTDYDIGG